MINKFPPEVKKKMQTLHFIPAPGGLREILTDERLCPNPGEDCR
jgi:hypothetical protein